jgi:uncharacterized protein (TIGR03437 family)
MLAAAVYAQPSISIVQNNYGWTIPGLPNYGIAQGSIFAISGTNLGPTDLVKTAAIPLQTTLSGVSVEVNVGGRSLPVPLYYVWNKAVAGVLPSTTPVGDGTLALTYNGQTATAPLHVVAHAFGILTTSGGGSGTVVARNFTQGGAPPSLAAYGNAVNAGEVLILYGSGLGASSNDTALQNEVVNWNDAIPVEVWIGGQQVRPDYAGRSGNFPGLDQINLTVPAGSQGCNVSLYVETGTGASANVSNVVMLPIGSGTNRACSDPGGCSRPISKP